MNNTAFVRLTLFALVLGTALVTSVLRFDNRAAVGAVQEAGVPAKEEQVKWELGELRIASHLYWNANTTGEAMPKQEIALGLADKVHKSETLAALAEALGKKLSGENPVELLTVLGREGWEPVSHSGTEWVNPGRAIKRVDVWFLKRRATK